MQITPKQYADKKGFSLSYALRLLKAEMPPPDVLSVEHFGRFYVVTVEDDFLTAKTEKKMKGKNTFTKKETMQIKSSLKDLRTAGRDSQKDIRAYLRNTFKFYISDFTSSNSGFTVEDFEKLVADKIITIK